MDPYNDRGGHERMVALALRPLGWDVGFGGAGGPATYEAHWGVSFTQPAPLGDPEEGFPVGRGTRWVDAQRVVPGPGGRHVRVSYLSLKGGRVTAAKPKPSYLVITAGTGANLAALVSACRRGNALPTAVFASPVGEDGPSPEGWWAAFDAAEHIRASDVLMPGWEPRHPHAGGYRKGVDPAPPVYQAWERKGTSAPDGWRDGVFREAGVAHYPCLKLSLKAAGIRLQRGTVADLAAAVQALPWGADGWYTVY